jgi:ketopantoate reductase
MTMSKRVEKRVEKFFNSKTTKQIKEFTINIVNDEKKKKLKEVIIKNIMKKECVEKVRDIIRLKSDALIIQTKSTKIKNVLQKQSKIIRRIIVSITIHNRIYVVQVNKIKIKHINEINPTNFITYLQKNNARLHLNMIIKKMI